MALVNGKNQWVNAMIAADEWFLNQYGGNLDSDPDARERLRGKYELQFDAIVDLISGNAQVKPDSLNVSGLTAAVVGSVATMNPPAIIQGTGKVE